MKTNIINRNVSTISIITEREGEREANSTKLRWLDGTLVAFVIENVVEVENGYLPIVLSSRPSKTEKKENNIGTLLYGLDKQEIRLTPEPTLFYKHEDSKPLDDIKIRTFGLVSINHVMLLDETGQEVSALIQLQTKQISVQHLQEQASLLVPEELLLVA